LEQTWLYKKGWKKEKLLHPEGVRGEKKTRTDGCHQFQVGPFHRQKKKESRKCSPHTVTQRVKQLLKKENRRR